MRNAEDSVVGVRGGILSGVCHPKHEPISLLDYSQPCLFSAVLLRESQHQHHTHRQVICDLDSESSNVDHLNCTFEAKVPDTMARGNQREKAREKNLKDAAGQVDITRSIAQK